MYINEHCDPLFVILVIRLYMQTASAKEIKIALEQRSARELIAICMRLARFKKENKELLTYLLFAGADEADYIVQVQELIDEQFAAINRQNWYHIKKGMRKILTEVRKYCRYSPHKSTEVTLRLYYCQRMLEFTPSIRRNRVLRGVFERQVSTIRTAIGKLHEDLQYDFNQELDDLLAR